MASFRAILDSLRSRPSPGRILLALGTLTAVALGWSLFSPASPSWVLLPGSSEDRSGVVAVFDDMAIRHESRSDGIYVTAPDRDRAAAAMAARRPDPDAIREVFSGAGIFANPQQISQQLHHALETELARMIRQMEAVRNAEVRIVAVAEQKHFRTPAVEASAAVLLDLKPGAEFLDEQARTVAEMISASVKGLTPERVRISDTRGRCYRVADLSPEAAASLELRERERRYSKDLEEKIGALFPEARRVVCVRLSAPKPVTTREPSVGIEKGGVQEEPGPAAASTTMMTPQGDVIGQLSISVILPVAERFLLQQKDRDDLTRSVVAQVKHATGLDRDDIFRVELHAVSSPEPAAPPAWMTGMQRALARQEVWIGTGGAGVVALLGILRWRRRGVGRKVLPVETPVAAPVEEPAVAGPFETLGRLSIDRTVQLLGDEHPQTIALVLTHVSTRRAGEVLERIPTALQVDVVRRMTLIQPPTPEVVADVERALERKLSIQRARATVRTGSPQQVARILSAINRDTETRILLGVQAQDPALAEKIRRPGPEAGE